MKKRVDMNRWTAAAYLAALPVFAGPSFAESIDSQLSHSQLRDPTKPANTVSHADQPLNTITLESILYSDNRRIAIINGQAFAVGDKLSGIEVTGIEPQQVMVKYNGDSRRLKLPVTSVKKTTSHNQQEQ